MFRILNNAPEIIQPNYIPDAAGWSISSRIAEITEPLRIISE